MVQARENAPLDEYLLDPALIDESSDEHLFETVVRLGTFTGWVYLLLQVFILELNFKNSSICAITDFAPLCQVCSNHYFLLSLPVSHISYLLGNGRLLLLRIHLRLSRVLPLLVKTWPTWRLRVVPGKNGLFESLGRHFLISFYLLKLFVTVERTIDITDLSLRSQWLRVIRLQVNRRLFALLRGVSTGVKVSFVPAGTPRLTGEAVRSMVEHSQLIWWKSVRVYFILLMELLFGFSRTFWGAMFVAVNLAHFISHRVLIVVERRVAWVTRLRFVHDEVATHAADSPWAGLVRVPRVVRIFSSVANWLLYWWTAASTNQMMVIRMLGGALSFCCDAWILKQSHRQVFVCIVLGRLLFVCVLLSNGSKEVRIVVEGNFSAHKSVVFILTFLALFWGVIFA